VSAPLHGNDLRRRDDGTVELSGRITFHTVPEYVARAAEIVNDARAAVTLDLGKVEQIDSAGVALLLEWLEQARAGQRELHFVNVPEQTRRLIGVSGLDEAFGL
jgi:phospholipid transport system transporter-binding protein